MAFLFSFLVAHTQTDSLFKYVGRSDLNLDQAQSDKLDSMLANPIYSNHYFVEVNPLNKNIDSGWLRVNLPLSIPPVLYFGEEFEFVSEDDYLFFGENKWCDTSNMSHIHIFSRHDNVFGHINYDGRHIYHLYDFGDRKNVLFEFDTSALSISICGVEEDTSQAKKVNVEINSSGNDLRSPSGGCNVRILVLYTDKAEQVGNPMDAAELFISQAQTSFSKSDVDVSVQLVGVEKLVGFNESSSPRTTRNRLADNQDAKDLRSDSNADIVCLLTDGNWSTPFGNINGIAFLDEWGDSDFGYFVTEIDVGTGAYTFTHELGHAFGCKHNNDNRSAPLNPQFEFSARAHSFMQGGFLGLFKKERNTVMNASATNLIYHFSNPDVNFGSVATGVENERDNAAQLERAKCTISDYIDYDDLQARIKGPREGSNFTQYTWCVDVDGCSNVTSIIWEISFDGITYFPIAGSSGQYCITRQLPVGRSVWFKATANCFDGQEKTAWWSVKNNDEPVPCGNSSVLDLKKTSNEDVVAISSQILDEPVYLSPNPATNSFKLEYRTTKIEDVLNVTMFSTSGNRVYTNSEKPMSIGINSTHVDVQEFEQGIYLVSGDIGGRKFSKRILVIK